MLTERKWKLETVPLLMIGLFLSVLLGAMTMTLLKKWGIDLESQSGQFLVLILNAMFVHGMLLLLMLLFLQTNRMTFVEAFGLQNGSLLRCAAIALGVCLLVLPATWMLGKLASTVMETFNQKPESQISVQFLQRSIGMDQWIFMGFTTMFLAPVVEEMLFRGIIYPSLKQTGFPRMAMYGTAFIFAAYHSNLMTFVPLFVLAVVLTVVYETTDNLLSSIFLHALFNAANFILLATRFDLEKVLRQIGI